MLICLILLLVTEYLNDITSKIILRGRYQERDRLQALFSDAIILASSYAKNKLRKDSGSRLAMEYARQYNIPRAVMYEESTDLTNPKYDLNRQLIREQKNILVIDKNDMEAKLKKLVNLKLNTDTNASQGDLF